MRGGSVKEFIVTIEVHSSGATLSELAATIGIDDNANSHTKNAARGARGAWDSTVWKMESGLKPEASLTNHIDSLLQRLPEKLTALAEASEDAQPCLNIGVLSDSVMCSLELDPRRLQIRSQNRFAVFITTYLAQPSVQKSAPKGREMVAPGASLGS
jgi:hypothetical protein